MTDEILYHYTSNDAFSKIIEANSLWLTDVRQSNDSEEVTYFLRLCEDYSKMKSELIENSGNLKGALPYRWAHENFQRLFNEHLDKLLVHACCFSGPQSKDKLSQWRGYASDGAGVAIGFSKGALESSLETSDLFVAGLARVKYLENEHEDELYSRLEEIIRLLPKQDGSSSEPTISLLKDSFLYKNKWFHEEDEWRICSISDIGVGGSAEPTKTFSKDDKVVSYSELKFDNIYEAIREIWLGPKNETRKNILEDKIRAKGYEHTKVMRSAGTYR